MSGPEFHPPPPQREDVPTRAVLRVLVAVLVLFVLAVWATLPIARWGAPPQAREVRVPRELGAVEVGLVDQLPFEFGARAQERRRRQLQRLSIYGWVDREAGTIHLPVERAVELLLHQGKEGHRE